MAGRPPSKDRKGNGYALVFPDGYLEKLDAIAQSRGLSRKSFLLKLCEDGFEKYGPAAAQTKMELYADGSEKSTQQQESTIRQGFLGLPGVTFKNILKTLIAEGIDPKERASMGKRIASWLKEKGIEVVY